MGNFREAKFRGTLIHCSARYMNTYEHKESLQPDLTVYAKILTNPLVGPYCLMSHFWQQSFSSWNTVYSQIGRFLANWRYCRFLARPFPKDTEPLVLGNCESRNAGTRNGSKMQSAPEIKWARMRTFWRRTWLYAQSLGLLVSLQHAGSRATGQPSLFVSLSV